MPKDIKNKTNFIILTFEGEGGSLVNALNKKGIKAFLGIVQDERDTLTDEEQVKYDKENKKEKPEMKKRRLSLYDGMIKKYPAKDILQAMKNIKDKENYIVISGLNNVFRYTEIAQKMGFTGLLPTQEDRLYEVDRNKGKELVKKHYPDLKVAEYQEFKTTEEGIKFLQGNNNTYVLKSMGDAGETVVPKNNNPEIGNQEIVDTLKNEKQDYEKNGYILEQKIMNGVELTPEAVFYNGELIFTDLDIETKTLFNGELGINVGCGIGLIVKTNPTDKINQIAFPKYVYEEAKKRKGIFIADAAIMFDKKTGQPYFLEFCQNRFGWDSFPIEITMSEGIDKFFNNLLKGENPLKYNFGASVRMFNLDQDEERYYRDGLSLIWEKEVDDYVFWYDIKKNKNKYETVGYGKDTGIVVAVGNSIEETINNVYDNISKVGFKDYGYRDKDDFLSESYPQAILNRYNWGKENNLY